MKVLTSTTDGGLVLYNGKHVVTALKKVQAKYDSMKEDERADQPWICPALKNVLEKGLMLAVYQFPDSYDRPRRQAVQGLSHEEEQNKLYHTTLQQKAKLVRAYFVREGNDWTKAKASLLQDRFCPLGFSRCGSWQVEAPARRVPMSEIWPEGDSQEFGG